jgi:hypothetical protein
MRNYKVNQYGEIIRTNESKDMMRLFVNLSNHPSDKWSKEQLAAAQGLGTVVDLPFPAVDPADSKEEIVKLAASYLAKVNELADDLGIDDVNNITVAIQGEFTFTHNFVVLAADEYIKCVAATSQRISIDLGNGEKKVGFAFNQFRPY